ncbi:MAG: TspO/MBR family protein [Bacteroidia bacterium]
MNRFIKLLLLILLPLAVGAISGYFSVSAIGSWYMQLNRPTWNPPSWLFGPVWTTLYLIMGYSSFRIAEKEKNKERYNALLIYGIQLFFNFWWSILFFGFHLIGTALIEIIILWILIVLMIAKFRKIDSLAAYLNIPYLLWVSFATVLTATIYSLN